MRAFVETCEAVAAIPGKKEKVRLIARYLQSLSGDDAARAAVFLTGRAFSQREERVLEVGGSQLASLVMALAPKGAPDLHAAYRKYGDLGDTAEHVLRERAGANEVSLEEVAGAFGQLPLLRTSAQKLAVLKGLFERASPAEVKYIIKIITGDLRIGSKEGRIEEAIACAFSQPLDAVRRANMLTGDIGETLKLAKDRRLASAAMRMFHPIGFMLATPVETPGEILKDQGSAVAVEHKYDGIRAQIHKNTAGVKIFSRTLNEVSEFPEILASLARLPGQLILDGEIVAWHGARPLPFTELQKRLGRKQLDLLLQRDIPVKFVAFDLLHQDGELLLDAPYNVRRSRLEAIFSGCAAPQVQIAGVTLCDTTEAVANAFRESLAAGHEGIVVKSLDSPYAPGRRGKFWLKLKEPFATLDVVVTAVEFGHGKRRHVLSDYTFAIRNGSQLLNIGKAYSGLTDAEIAAYTEHFLQHTREDQGSRRIVEPTVVIEVAFNDIQRSDRHESGYALRFPRIVRLRTDKRVGEIDTLERAAELFAKQATMVRDSRTGAGSATS